MYHHRGTKTGLIGEDAALEAHLHCGGDACADHAACGGLHAEGTLEDGNENSGDGSDVHGDDHQCAQKIEDHHKGHQLFGDGGHPLQSAQNHSAHGHQQKDASGDGGNAEGSMNIGHNGIDLTHIADAEGSQQAEEGEQHGEHAADGLTALFGTQTIPEIVHGAAVPLACLILPAEENAQNVFGVVGHHAKECDEPHPEHSTRAAYGNGTCHAHDITGAHSGGQCRAEGLKLRDGAVFGMTGNVLILKDCADGVFHPVADVAQLKKLGQAGHQYAYKAQQDQRRPAPNHIVNGTVDVCDGFYHEGSLLLLDIAGKTKSWETAKGNPSKRKLCPFA